MRNTIGIGVFGGLMIGLMSWSYAGPEQIALPGNYAESFIPYTTVDKRDRKPDIVRVMYIDPQSAAAAQPGSPLPEGTRIVMAEHLAAAAADGQTLFDRDGRMIPSKKVQTIFVAEKRAGFGADYDEAERIGDWEFAAFLNDGSRKPDVDFGRCRECHMQAIRTDFTFSVFPNLDVIKQ